MASVLICGGGLTDSRVLPGAKNRAGGSRVNGRGGFLRGSVAHCIHARGRIQWAGRLGILGEATTLAPGNWQGRVWQGHVWNTLLAITLWLVWFYG